MRISDYAISRPISVYVLLVVIIIGGAVAYADLPREAAPEIEIPLILVTTPYLGVSPEDIESLITHPIERELKEIKEIDELRSTSAEGASIVTIKFTTDANLDEAIQEVREKIDLARPKLPDDAEDPIIQEISTSDFPMMIVNVTAKYDLTTLRDVAEDLQDRIENQPGVLEVKLAGGIEREIQVQVDPVRLDHYGLTFQDLINAIRSENINMPGGDIEVGDSSFLVRVPGEFEQVETIQDIAVKLRGDHPAMLSHVATVVDGYKDRETLSRLDGRSNVSLTITKRAGVNIITLADGIKELIEERKPHLPAGTEIVILSDASKDIRSLVNELENNMLTGLILVIGVILVSMGLRNSLLVAVAIPLSMLITMIVLTLLGITLNMIVLFSLILALGMLVDNAIVIIENIYRHASEGKTRVQAAYDGTREVAWPVATSTLTTVGAFTPLLFWPGIVGKFMGYMPRTLIITLTASLFVALVINPVLAATFVRPKAPSSQGRRAGRGQVLTARFMAGYEGFLHRVVRHRGRSVVAVLLVFVASLLLFGASGLGVQFFPDVAPQRIIVDVDAGDGTRLAMTDSIVRRIEGELRRHANVEHYVADVGTGGGGLLGIGGSVAHKGRLSVDFLQQDDQVEPVTTTIDKMRSATDDIAGARIEIQKEKMGPPGGAPVSVELYGEDFRVLDELSQRVRARIAGIPGLVDLRDDYTVGRPELRVEIDRVRAKVLNASTNAVASTVRTAINGTKASVFRDGEDEYDITVRLAAPFRDRLADIENLRVNVGARKDPDARYLIPIREVANIKTSAGTGSIRHKELDRVVTIEANAEGRLATAVLADVQQELKDLPLPPGYSIGYAGESEDRDEAQAFLSKALLVALFLIILVLVSQFNSVTLPAVIMLAVVLSLVGVFWGQMLLGLPFGIIMTGLGVFSLAGVVVNNGIVLVDYIQQLRQRGYERDAAIVRAGVVRLRPVLLTAITTVLGLLPMALGVSIDFATLSWQVGGRNAAFWHPMAVAVIFGLLVATVLTLVVVPVLYSLFDDLQVVIGRMLAGVGIGYDDSRDTSPKSRS